jgi:surfeit locus 1 family protein
MRVRFRPGLLAATLGALAILVSLGTWQLQRKEWKEALIAAVEARLSAEPVPFDDAVVRAEAGETMEYQPVYLDGVFAHDNAAGVFGTYEGRAGVYLFAPLRRSDGSFVYINRGFAPQNAKAANSEPQGAVRVYGLLRRAEVKRGLERLLAPKDQPADKIFFTRDPRTLGAAAGIYAPPIWYVDSNGLESDGPWPKGGLTRVDFPNRHLEYALTWFGLAAALVGVFLAFSLKRD